MDEVCRVDEVRPDGGLGSACCEVCPSVWLEEESKILLSEQVALFGRDTPESSRTMNHVDRQRECVRERGPQRARTGD